MIDWPNSESCQWDFFSFVCFEILFKNDRLPNFESCQWDILSFCLFWNLIFRNIKKVEESFVWKKSGIALYD